MHKKKLIILTYLVLLSITIFQVNVSAYSKKTDSLEFIGAYTNEYSIMLGEHYDISESLEVDGILKNTITGETCKAVWIGNPEAIIPDKLGTYDIEFYIRGELNDHGSWLKSVPITINVVPPNPDITMHLYKKITVNKAQIMPDLTYGTISFLLKDTNEGKIYCTDTLGRKVKGEFKMDYLKVVWGYNKVKVTFKPYKTFYSTVYFNSKSQWLDLFLDQKVNIMPFKHRISIAYAGHDTTHQARINGGKWRSIRQTNQLVLKPNTKYKVEIRQKAESFHKAIILQTSYVKTK